MPIDTYEQKIEIILRHHLVLWDVIHACEREGSLDSRIHAEVVNPIDALTEAYPLIHTVICNGKKSETLYQRHFAHLPLKQIYLPSTSNANRTIKEEALFACWIRYPAMRAGTIKRYKEKREQRKMKKWKRRAVSMLCVGVLSA